MKSEALLTRPSLKEALDAWKKALAECGFPTDLIWIFAENFCVERSRADLGSFHFGFQTRFTPPPEDALDIAYEHFSESDKPVVFYRLGGQAGKSVCALLCDSWFEHRGDTDGFLRRDEWGVLFYPGSKDEIEEVTELTRWLRRVRRDRAFHELDFCMALEAIDEIKIYGRVLAPYERMATAMLGRFRRFLGQPA
jgi:hypothetical protein